MSAQHIPIKADPERVKAQKMQPTHTIRLADESNEDVNVVVEAVPPTWRDIWSILRGTYKPMVRRRRTTTAAGLCKTIKEVWTAPSVKEQLYADSPLLDLLKRN
jgi:hypothetical protein